MYIFYKLNAISNIKHLFTSLSEEEILMLIYASYDPFMPYKAYINLFQIVTNFGK